MFWEFINEVVHHIEQDNLPTAVFRMQVMADWLDERGDSRAETLRLFILNQDIAELENNYIYLRGAFLSIFGEYCGCNDLIRVRVYDRQNFLYNALDFECNSSLIKKNVVISERLYLSYDGRVTTEPNGEFIGVAAQNWPVRCDKCNNLNYVLKERSS